LREAGDAEWNRRRPGSGQAAMAGVKALAWKAASTGVSAMWLM
jgi:hypothetical protein